MTIDVKYNSRQNNIKNLDSWVITMKRTLLNHHFVWNCIKNSFFFFGEKKPHSTTYFRDFHFISLHCIIFYFLKSSSFYSNYVKCLNTFQEQKWDFHLKREKEKEKSNEYDISHYWHFSYILRASTLKV